MVQEETSDIFFSVKSHKAGGRVINNFKFVKQMFYRRLVDIEVGNCEHLDFNQKLFGRVCQ